MKFMHLRESFPSWKTFLEKMQTDKKRALIVLLCAAALLLLVLSEWMGGRQSAPAQTQETDYAAELETKLSQMISAIDGAGRTKVLVTLKGSGETVYARNDKMEADSTRTQSEQAYVLVRSGSDETGLRLKTVTPQVLGVAVVCEGADVPQVRQAIMDTITAALDIGASHVSVVRMQSERKN